MRHEVVVFDSPIQAYYWDHPEVALGISAVCVAIAVLLLIWAQASKRKIK